MTQGHKVYLSKLLAIKDITAISIEEALQRTALLVDLSSQLDCPEGTELALQWCDSIQGCPLTPGQRSLLEFYRANAWDDARKRKYNAEDYAWIWEQPELRSQLLSLRRAAQVEGLTELQPVERSQIFTNLGNQLNSAGRLVEAGEYWTRAIHAHPKFAMALANRGYAWYNYARAHYDPGHQTVFLYRAHQSLSAALARGADWGSAPDGARDFFVDLRARIAKLIDVKRLATDLKLDGYGLGRSRKERGYRRWALDHILFLNPLNDLGNSDIAATDALSLPSYRTPLDDGPTLIAFFNQMKQEFASARWLLFEGITDDAPHFSDRDTKLHDTLDDPGYSLSIEKTKLAFRSAYSLLDKVAFFLNDYLKLGIPLAAVSFRSLWFEKRGSATLRPDGHDRSAAHAAAPSRPGGRMTRSLSDGSSTMPSGSGNRCAFSVIAVADESIDGATLARWRTGGIVGLRFTEMRTPSGERYPGSVGFAALHALAPRMREIGLNAQLWANASQLAEHLPGLLRLGVPLVIDHMGCPDPREGPDEPAFAGIVDLLADGALWMKLVICRLSAGGSDYARIRPLHDRLVERAPHRLVWGSDWPYVRIQPTPDAGYLADVAQDWVQDDELIRRILVANPAKLYDFNEEEKA
ncbi:LA2681 family HEPN domain-containing protein [Bradyrhizobium ottawaense]|uniref:Uncharacterized protein n=1 Tax=Bradyrhizobium ottawaense TaxID=931866 RepID=A0A2U8PGB7_9BRAD|nr:LA2681 family HEPN domain-containing protein [Bradyrhizobium ottawaense]AWL96811.1 hypothetical protein CIT37_35295 [Bradyrhizobium ottawaense]MBR1326061.1 amidohydrolase family protein [Bradyrhizobium ottawaense]